MLDLTTYIVYFSTLIIVVSLCYIGSKVYAHPSKVSKSPVFFLQYEDGQHKEHFVLNIFHALALLLICSVVALRYEVGHDWGAYNRWYEYYRRGFIVSSRDSNFEVGYYFINFLLAKTGVGSWLMFGCVALISWGFIFKSLPVKLLPLLFFFLFTDEYFFVSMNLVRQFVALGIFTCAVKFIVQRKFLPYIACVSFAFLFHTSAALLVPLYFIPYHRLYNRTVWLVLLAISFFLANSPGLLIRLINIALNVLDVIPIFSTYTRYFISERFFEFRPDVGLGYIFRLLVSVFIVFFSKTVVDENPKLKPYFVLVFIGLIIYNLFYMIPLIARINHYFLILRSVALALICFELWKSRNIIKRNVVISLVVLYTVLFGFAISIGSHKTAPYRTIFSEKTQ